MRLKPILASALAAALAAQDTVIRVDVQLVRVVATVKNQHGEPVGTLAKDDFRIFDNGVEQEIGVFDRQSEQPLSVAVLLDASGSTAKDIKYSLDSVSRFSRALFKGGHGNDALSLFSFNYETTRHTNFTRNQGAVERAMKAVRPEAGTSLYDAVFLASEDLEERDGRKVIVVVTDGGDTTSRKDFHAALKQAHMADAVIYSILVMPITNDAGRNIGGENALATMAARTGGRVFTPAPGPELDRAFDEILRDLRMQYVLGFYPKNVPLNKNPFHSLRVESRRPELRVSARSGYYGESSPQ